MDEEELIPDEVELEEEEEHGPLYLAIQNGSLVIFDVDKFVEETGARALQVTDEGGVYIVNDQGKLVPLELDKPKRKLKTVE